MPVPLSAEVRQDVADAGIDVELIAQQPQPAVQTVRAAPPERRGQIVMQAEMHSGPLPHPAILKGYNDVVPGSADRIITQFEEQGRHRRKQESRVISHNLFSASLGQVLAFVFFMTIAVGGGWLIYAGKSLEGSGALVAGLASAIWVLRGAKKAKEEDLEEKRSAGKSLERRRK